MSKRATNGTAGKAPADKKHKAIEATAAAGAGSCEHHDVRCDADEGKYFRGFGGHFSR